MSDGEWGDWIEHDGTCRPVAKGQYVQMVGIYPDGESVVWEGYVRTDAYSWYWFNFGRMGKNGVIPKCVRYRIWMPRALLELIEMVESLPARQPVPA